MASSGTRTRGPNKQKPWSRDPADGVSVLRLALDVSDPMQRSHVESLFECAYPLYRALRRDARDRCRAYGSARKERANTSPKEARERLGLSKVALEYRAYEHLNRAPHLRQFATKAIAMNLADAVWASTERHLFRDASGKRQGAPRVGGWYDFRRIPGRAKSHTTDNKWETFRLHGDLAAHRAAYTNAASDFVQPRKLRAVESDSWWRYNGPLAVVFSGPHSGEIVLPVRLPTAPSNQPILDHHLGDPSRWHKIDLVRYRDPNALGGWRYEAHLMVMTQPYVSPSTVERRARAAIETMDRSAGIDVNVSNITVASHDTGRDLKLTAIERDTSQRESDRVRRKRERRRRRELERSRRAANRAQYHLSKRQEKRARRRAEAGLREVEVIPMGPRKARADGVPLQSYRRDELSKSYRRGRAAQAAEAQAGTRARRDHARQIAAELVATHGYQLVVEDVSIGAWSRSWGRALAAFSPATFVTAIDREAAAVAAIAGGSGGVVRASTRTTALSQHCPCGARVPKRLSDRAHECPACGLRGDRDATSAVLASFVTLVKKGDPSSAQVDYDAARDALPAIKKLLGSAYKGWQDTLSESNDLSARDGSFIAWATSTPDTVAVARRNVGTAPCATLHETGSRQTTADRARVRTNMFSRYGPVWPDLRDKS